MKIAVRIATIAAAALAALAALAWFVPLSHYVPRIEQEASGRLGQPVRVGALHLLLLPRPQLRIAGIEVGVPATATIEAVDIVPALRPLLSGELAIERIDVRQPRLTSGIVLPAVEPGDAGPPAVRVAHLHIEAAELNLAAGPLPPFDADIRFDERGRPAALQVRTRDGALAIDGAQQGDAFALSVAARDWRVPAGPPLQFDSLHAQGRLAGRRLEFDQVDARLYGGTLSGGAGLAWEKGWSLAGNIVLQGVVVEHLLKLAGAPPRLAGRLDGIAKFSAAAREPAALAEALRASGRFSLKQGTLKGVDLGASASLLGKSGASGGDTAFDSFTGTWAVAGRSLRLDSFDISSGLLSASGQVAVSPARALSGKVYVEMKTGASLVKVPLRVAGTAADPLLYPTGAALAGAAAGTAVMGPGAGTALGSRVADAIENLFGGRK